MTDRPAGDIWGKHRPRSIACIGEAMIELSFESASADKADLSGAGDSFNVAVHLKRNWNGPVSYVTIVGTDAMSQRIIDFAKTEKIETSLIAQTPSANVGLYAITNDEVGERSFTYWRSASAARKLFSKEVGPDLNDLLKFEAIYLSGITLAILPPESRKRLIEWLKSYRDDHGGVVIFDSNYRPALWESVKAAQEAISAMWSLSDIALPTIEDEEALYGPDNADDVAVRLELCGVTTGAVKCGHLGPYPIGQVCSDLTFPAVDHAFDTTGAGDSFNGGFLSAWLNGNSLGESLKKGHDLASVVVTIRGAIPLLSEFK